MNNEENFYGIKSWAANDRPREKALERGFSALSDAELLAILIGTGTAKESAVDLARKLLCTVDNDLNSLAKKSLVDLSSSVKGIGKAKAISIGAAIELGKRRASATPKQDEILRSSMQVAEVFRASLCDLPYEEFWVLLLNRSNKILAKYLLSRGGLYQTVVDARIIMKYAVQHLAVGIVLCHNHPSGNLQPSDADKVLTRNIANAAKMLEINVLDHIIIAHNEYFSFSDEGLL